MEANSAKDNHKSQIVNRKSVPRLSGTREWAAHTINIQQGCEHDCRYCYARYDAVTRYKRCTREQWREPTIFAARVDTNYRRLKGRVMFSSTHDITQRNIAECLTVLHKLLEAGNEVLIVSKPDYDVVALLVEALKKYQHRVAFRFTIGSVSDDVLKFWEPGAPNFESRRKSLMCAFMEGYCTSVSCEPYLDAFPQHVFEACYDYISYSERQNGAGGFWIGKLRHWGSRVDLTGVTDEEIKLYVDPLKVAQGDDFVRGLVHMLDGRRFIRWKDSIREVIERQPQSTEKILATESTEDTEDSTTKSTKKGKHRCR